MERSQQNFMEDWSLDASAGLGKGGSRAEDSAGEKDGWRICQANHLVKPLEHFVQQG